VTVQQDIDRLRANEASEESHDEEAQDEVTGTEAEAPRQRQVVVVPGAYDLNDDLLTTPAGEFAELSYGCPNHAGLLYLTRAQMIELGGHLLTLAGKMKSPKDLEREAATPPALAVVERDTTLVGPDGVTPLA
jgi:hypothetical protein